MGEVYDDVRHPDKRCRRCGSVRVIRGGLNFFQQLWFGLFRRRDLLYGLKDGKHHHWSE